MLEKAAGATTDRNSKRNSKTPASRANMEIPGHSLRLCPLAGCDPPQATRGSLSFRWFLWAGKQKAWSSWLPNKPAEGTTSGTLFVKRFWSLSSGGSEQKKTLAKERAAKPR